MSVLQRLQQQALAVQGVGLDMSQVSKGGAGKRLLPTGRAFARLIGYREFGNHINTFQGKPKPPAMKIRLTFAIWGKGDPTGPDVQENCYHYLPDGDKPLKHGTLTSFDLTLGNNEKAKIKAGFDKMNWSKKHKGFATMLGEAFLLPITVKQPKKADGKPYNEIDWGGILPPMDPMSGAPYNVPAVPDEDYFAFLWNNPTKEDWDAMFIDGTNDKGQSKNFLQAMAIKAVNFEGSPLQQLLGGALPDIGDVEGDDEPDTEEASAAGAIPAVPTVAGAQAVPGVQTPAVPDITAGAVAVGAVQAIATLPEVSPLPDAGVVQTPVGSATVAVPGVPDVGGLAGIPGLN